MEKLFHNVKRKNIVNMALKPTQRAFLSAYAESANVSLAAEVTNIARRSHYYWLRTPEYVQVFDEARDDAIALLEAEARHRAVDGIETPIFHAGKQVYEKKINRKTGEVTMKPVTRRKYSDILLMFLLKAYRPEKYRDNWQGRPWKTSGAPVGVDLTRLSDAEGRQLRAMVDKVRVTVDGDGVNTAH